MRRTGMIVTVIVFVWVLGATFHSVAVAAPKNAASFSQLLCQEYLQGSMQGRSGISIDLNGDGNEDLVVGAPYADQKGSSGALLVYHARSGGFQKQASMVLPGAGNLGWSLTTLGDVHNNGKPYFAAGAFTGSGQNVSLSGTVTVYRGGPTLSGVTVLEGENAMDKFGFALASGDLNGDGTPDLIVGAPMHSPTPSLYQQGAVYVYFGPNYNPIPDVRIPATASVTGIGLSVASGDINGDGVDDLIIGASGKVLGYYGNTGSFNPTPEKPDVVFTSPDSGFGLSIATLWDVDDDGFRDLAVGASKALVFGVSETGRLYILRGGPGTRTVNVNENANPDVLATIDGEPNSGQFASAILPLPDVDGCGFPDLAVSAVHADGSYWPMTGKVFFFSGQDLTPGVSLASAKTIPGSARDMHLGSFLALASGRWLAAGAPTEKANTGSVRLFDVAPPHQ